MLIAGNWKMNTDLASGTALAENIADAVAEAGDALDGVDLAVCPPYVHLTGVIRALKGSGVEVGAQDVHHEDEGAYTGDVSAPMLVSAGCNSVIVGHSERREYYGETDADVNAKIQQAHDYDLTPILCVGETIDERRAGNAKPVVRTQLTGALDGVDVADASELIVAYEPVWAIGTGETATPEQAQEMHAFIREQLTDRYGALAADVEILYGGSMKPHNAAELLSQPDVTGGLVGGASLQAESFIGIAEHAGRIVDGG
jgi:triosephosphate isomerase